MRTNSSVSSGDLQHWPILCGRPLFTSFKATINSHLLLSDALASCNGSPNLVAYDIPLNVVAGLLPVAQLRDAARNHGVKFGRSARAMGQMVDLLRSHSCGRCPRMATVVDVIGPVSSTPLAIVGGGREEDDTACDSPDFPPLPCTFERLAQCVREWQTYFAPGRMVEGACAVCATLCSMDSLANVEEKSIDLAPLIRDGEGVTRRYRESVADPVEEIPSPILEPAGIFCREGRKYLQMCATCLNVLRHHQLPARALANGRWIGAVPDPLQGLTYAEEMLISPFRRNGVVAHMAYSRSRVRYLKTNVLVFEQPMLKIYTHLPPPREELEDMLAILFTGPVRPTNEDYKDNPMLVRHKVVMRALECLKLNHRKLEDIVISPENLATYPEDEPAVCIMYRPSENPGAENLAVYEREEDADECPFIVRALTGAQYAKMMYQERLVFTIKYFAEGNKALSIRHEDTPESIYHNPELYPNLFPWLYPYGLGGFENDRILKRLDRLSHIRAQLRYCDRRFQTDRTYPFVAFSHEQLRSSYTAGYLLTKRQNFSRVVDKLLSVDILALDRLVARSKASGYAQAEDDAERACFELMGIVDHVAGHVAGTNTRRKWQRNEIRSLTYARGTPTFFVTFAPADTKNPICLRLCGIDIDLSIQTPSLPDDWTRMKTVAKNPVGAATFFDHVVQALLKFVLCVDGPQPGIFGPVDSYFGTVEEQGRKTLHLHLLIWIKNSLLPAQLRERTLKDEVFRTQLVQWLESCHTGDFYTANESSLSSELETFAPDRLVSGVFRKGRATLNLHDPATTLVATPPSSSACADPTALAAWYESMRRDADEVVFTSNRHSRAHDKGCLRGDPEYCRGRFPREIVQHTKVDLNTGAVRFRKTEEWINTYHPVMAVLCRCNTDVTCLLSGTAVREVIAYVADYITKSVLNTHKFFARISHVIKSNRDLIAADDVARTAKGRKLLTKMVNSLAAAAEIGGPAACAHLLGYPDHYTNHRFKTVYWYSYVRVFMSDLPTELRLRVERTPSTEGDSERIMVEKTNRGVVAMTKTNDYVHRPDVAGDMCLYEFWRRTEIKKLSRKRDDRLPLDTNASSCGDAANPDAMLVDSERRNDRDLCDVQADDMDGNDHSRVHPFLADHPKHDTHGVLMLAEQSFLTVNFVGGLLPRRDKGNQEEYAMVMLMLFAPGGWRRGSDLLAGESSWLPVFERTSFSDVHRAVMDNMMALFDCQDARDDYSNQRRMRKTPDTGLPANINSTALDDDVNNVAPACETVEDLGDLLLNQDPSEGKSSAMHKKEMRHMQLLLRRLHGESDSSITYAKFAPSPGAVFHWPSASHRSAATWKNLVQAERTHVLDSRQNPRRCHPEEDMHSSFSSSRELYTGRIDLVTIVDKDDIARMRISSSQIPRGIQDQELLLLHSTIQSYGLNEEQRRAFFIVSKHLYQHDTDPLRMFLAGMAGTGKSRVVLAILDMLKFCNEASRFLVLGPTGRSASLIGGSTYHSVLGFGFDDDDDLSLTKVEKIRERLQNVDVIFIDEISMISCEALTRIYEALVRAFRTVNVAFGGKSMVFAGDFAQLMPPGRGHALYSDSVIAAKSPFTAGSHHAAQGKAIWHMFTTVVILRENMRQQCASPEDEAFRRCLAHMRYARCDAKDIALLRSRICKTLPDGFKDVPIITARNAYRDVINETYAKRFAQEHGKELHTFVSLDFWGNPTKTDSVRAMQRFFDSTAEPVRMCNDINGKLQQVLWDLKPTLSGHHTGKLLICEGMPVTLKYNEATELGATNGAEAIVVGWDSYVRSDGMEVLDTLFVRLVTVTDKVRIPGLPDNVIPLPRTRKTVKCTLPVDDLKVSIHREQVTVLQSFALTDFGCQGGTRARNVVYLRYCSNHQSIYTCLSRSTSLRATVIIDDFDISKIQKGASRALQAEFRDIELLDEITKRMLAGTLPVGVQGETRGELISTFLAAMEDGYIPPRADLLIGWPNKPKNQSSRAANGAMLTKRKQPTDDKNSRPGLDKRRRRCEDWLPVVHDRHSYSAYNTRIGLRWDSCDYSCAYDAFFTIIWQLRMDFGVPFLRLAARDNAFLCMLITLLETCDPAQPLALEPLRDVVRDSLSVASPTQFPRRGPTAIYIADLLQAMLSFSAPIATSTHICLACGYRLSKQTDITHSAYWTLPAHIGPENEVRQCLSIQAYVDNVLDYGFHTRCPVCSTEGPVTSSLVHAPVLIALGISSWRLTVLVPQLTIPVGNSVSKWDLCAVIYNGANHYVHRYVGSDGRVWFHDGQKNRGLCTQTPLPSSPEMWSVHDDAVATHAIYRRI